MLGGRRIEPLGRRAALGIATARVGIGVGALLATEPALRALGFRDVNASARALGRLAGGRDVALGLLTIAARDDRRALQVATVVSAAVDAADAIAFGLASRDAASRRAGTLGAVSGTAATLAGLWAWRRLGSRSR